jgi:ribokinase
MNSPKIIVVGSTNTDLVVRVPRIPAPGETVLGGALQVIAGGKGANQAVAAARLGGRVVFIARIGDDAYGAAAKANLEAEGIDTEFVFTTKDTASGVALIAVTEGAGGENAIVVAPGANAFLCAADIQNASYAFEGASALIVSLEIPDEAAFAAIDLAHAKNIPVIVNPAPARPLPAAILSKITVLTPNTSEVLLLAADCETLEDAAFDLVARGVNSVIVTRGASGSFLADANGGEVFATPSVTAIDTVAAGDTFTGALAVKIASGERVYDSIGFASHAAALKVTRHGAQPGIPTRAEVEAFLNR